VYAYGCARIRKLDINDTGQIFRR